MAEPDVPGPIPSCLLGASTLFFQEYLLVAPVFICVCLLLDRSLSYHCIWPYCLSLTFLVSLHVHTMGEGEGQNPELKSRGVSQPQDGASWCLRRDLPLPFCQLPAIL